MATEGRVVIRITADGSAATGAISAVKDALGSMGAAAGGVDLSAAFGNGASAADGFSGAVGAAKDAIGDAAEAAGDSDFTTPLEEGEEAAGRFSEALDSVKGMSMTASIALGNLAAQGIQQVIGKVGELASDVMDVGRGFEEAMSKVQALSGATGDELAALEAKAREMGATTTYTATDAADALGYMALAGWDATESVDGLDGVLSLAQASSMDLANASDIVTDYLSAFGLQASDSAHFADVLAYSQANANTTTEGLGMAFKNCSANANAAGMDVETTSAAIAMMANQGLKGSEAGTALNAVMRDMTSRMKDGSISIGDASVAVMDAQGNYRDFVDVLGDIEAATAGMGDAQKAAALQSTFTADSIKGLNLLVNAGSGQMDAFRASLYDCDGTAKDMADTMTDNVAGGVAQAQSAFEDFCLKVYDGFDQQLKVALDQVPDLFDGAGDAGEALGAAVGDLVAGLGRAATVLPQIVTAGVGFAVMLRGATSAMTAFAAAEAVAFPWLAVVVTAVGAVAGGLSLASAAMETYADETVAADEGLSHMNSRLSETKGRVDSVKSSMDAARDATADNVGEVEGTFARYEYMAERLREISDESGNVEKGHRREASVIASTLNEALGTNIEVRDGQIQKYDEQIGKLDQLIEKKKAEAYVEAFGDEYAEAIRKQSDAAEAYGRTMTDLAEAEKQFAEAEKQYKADMEAVNASNGAYAGDAGIAAKYAEATANINEAKAAAADADQTFKQVSETIGGYDKAQALMNEGDYAGAISALQALGTQARNTSEDIAAASGDDKLRMLQENVTDYANAMQGAIKNGNEEMAAQARKQIAETVAAYSEAGGDISEALANGITDSSGNVVLSGQELFDGLSTTLGDAKLMDAMRGLGSDAFDKYAAGMGSKVAKVTAQADAVAAETEKINKNAGKSEGWGSNLVGNFVSGILSKVKDARDASLAVAEAAASNTKHSVPKEGPLSDDDQWGYHFMDNLLRPIEEGRARARRASQGVAASLAGADWYSPAGTYASVSALSVGGASPNQAAQAPAARAKGAAGGIVINLNYSAGADANQMVMDIAAGLRLIGLNGA